MEDKTNVLSYMDHKVPPFRNQLFPKALAAIIVGRVRSGMLFISEGKIRSRLFPQALSAVIVSRARSGRLFISEQWMG